MVKRRDKKYSYPRVGLKTMSSRIRDWIAESFRKEDIHVSTYNRKDGSYGLWINGFEGCEKFRIKFGFRHPKQKQRLDELLSHEEDPKARGAG